MQNLTNVAPTPTAEQITVPAARKPRLVYLDILNIVACVAVVCLHCTSGYFHPTRGSGWYCLLAVQSVCIFAVPMFFTLSGATLMNYRSRYSTKEFLVKRFQRVVIPFLAWSAFYIVWRVCNHQMQFTGVADVIQKFLHNDINTVFWFFYAMIPMYLCVPFLSLVFTKDRIMLVRAFLLCGIISTMLIPLWNRFFPLYNLGKWQIPVVGGFMSYFALGWLLMNDSLFQRKNVRILIYCGGILSVAANILLTIPLTFRKHTVDKTFITSNSVTSLLIAASIFLLVRELCTRYGRSRPQGKIALKVLPVLSGASLGVYLVQNVFRDLMRTFFPKLVASVVAFPVNVVLIYGLSLLAVLILKKIPLLKHIVP